MTHFVTKAKSDSPMVAKVYLDNILKICGFPEDVISDQD